jgi:hypothetical protein
VKVRNNHKLEAEEPAVIAKDEVEITKSPALTPLHQERITGYLKSGDLTDRQGNELGSYNITSTWYVGRYKDPMHQVSATVNGVSYTGRSQGEGYIFRGRLAKS